MPGEVLFDISSIKDLSDPQEFLDNRYATAPAGKLQESRQYLDTFDWLLHQKGMQLYYGNRELSLLQRDNRGKQFSSELFSQQELPRFAADLPEGAAAAARAIGNRALLVVCRLYTTQIQYNILNEDDKTVVRLGIIWGGFLPEQKRQGRIWLGRVRGYDYDFQQVMALLAKAGFAPVNNGLFASLLKEHDRKPGDYHSRPDLHLMPMEPADKALRKILRFLAGVIRKNENGILKDLDIEFLHDFRVALRRTRCALNQMDTVLPAPALGRFRKHLAAIARQTNRLRDLDVYLESRNHLHSLLPAAIRDDLAPLFLHLAAERKIEQERVSVMLRSPHYTRIMNEWEYFLENALSERTADGRKSLEFIAGRQIYALYRKILKKGGAIGRSGSDQQLHRLRLSAKKLRYMMEFFSRAFGKTSVRYLIRQLKLLQDNLGRFQDLCVQEEMLLEISRELPGGSRKARQLLVAIGALIGILHHEKLHERDKFEATFSNFCSDDIGKRFQRCFGHRGDRN